MKRARVRWTRALFAPYRAATPPAATARLQVRGRTRHPVTRRTIQESSTSALPGREAMENPPEATLGRAVRVGSIVMQCHALEPMLAFWSRALGYSPNEAGRNEHWCRLDDPNGRVNVSLQVVPDPTPGENKFHLD